MKKLSQIFASVMLMGGLLFSVLAPAVVVANTAEEACKGIRAAGGTCTTDGSAAEGGFEKIVTTIINTLSIIVGAVSVIMIIIGGFRYIISGGDSNGVSGAKNTILYAIVGLVVVLFAQIIVAFVYSSAQPPRATADPVEQVAPAQN